MLESSKETTYRLSSLLHERELEVEELKFIQQSTIIQMEGGEGEGEERKFE